MNNKSFYIFGLIRSGNHAIIEWLCSMMDKPLHMNNMFPSSMYVNACHSLKESGSIHNLDEFEDLIISYENVPVPKIDDIVKMNVLFKQHNKDKCKKIIIVRDIVNWLASVYTLRDRRSLDHINVGNLVSHWRKYFNFSEDDEYVFINYNKWNSDEEYRKEIAIKLDLEYCSDTLNNVADFGSSFYDNFDEENSKKFNERWKLVTDNKEFTDMLNTIGPWYLNKVAEYFNMDISELKYGQEFGI